MYRIVATGKFKKDLKTVIKRGYNMKLMDEVVTKLSNGEKLPEKTKTMLWSEIMLVRENVILLQTGF